ncbi:hypothetical protein BH10ACT10_BH10ACT10_08560 [soil metagenome]
MRVLLAGLMTRRGMNATSLLVTVIAIVAAVLGPMYGRETAEHLLDTRLDERAPYTTGLSYSVASANGVVPDSLAALEVDQAPAVDELLPDARQPFQEPGVTRYWSSPRSWALDVTGTFTRGPQKFVAPTYWRQGMCDLATVTGRCPRSAGEALMQATMAKTLGLRAGDTFGVTYLDDYFGPIQGGTKVEKQRRRLATYRIVGTYVVDDPASPDWFDLSRFTGLNDLVVPPQRGTGSAPSAPALLVAPTSMVSQAFRVGVDRPLDTTAVDLDPPGGVEGVAVRFKTRAIDASDGGQTEVLPDLDLGSVIDQVRSERTLLSRVMIAATVPLVLLTLLLLFALVSAAAQVRRPHVALAKLRGQSRAQVLRFALSEPFLVVLVAVPVGVGVAVGAAPGVARGWMSPGTPVGLEIVTVLSLVAVVASALVASTVAALTVIREPLSAALAGSVRRTASGRVSLVLRSAVVAVALASVGNLLTSGDQSSQLLALLTPTFVALAIAVAGALLLRGIGRVWTRRTATSGGAPAYLAARRLSRRNDVANLMIPLLLAAAVLTFAAATTATSDSWRVARAQAEVGAARTYVTSSSPGRLLQVTRQVDPDGKYLAAAATDTIGDDLARSVFVDTSRLARVVAWDPAWSDRSIASLQKALTLDHDRRITFAGRDLLVDVGDVALRSRTGVRSTLRVQYVDDRGEQKDLTIGELRNGPRQVLEVPLEGCAQACVLEQLYVTGSSVSVSDVQGRLTIMSVEVDNTLANWQLEADAWRPARPFPVSLVDPPVVISQAQRGLELRLYLGQLPEGQGPQNAQVSGFARITPATTPDTVPALVTTGTRTETADEAGSGIALTYPRSTVAGVSLNGQQVPMRVVDRVRALPLVGTEGSLSDLETALVEFDPPFGALVTTQLLVADGTPASVIAAVRAEGVALADPVSLDGTLEDLRGDAFSLGLRLFLVVGAATLLIAVFGVFASAVLQSRWRSYEVASLRVVGVSQRALVRASVLEYVVLLGVAVLLGVLSAYLSLLLVLPSISLGTAGVHDPAPVYDTPWVIVVGVAAALFVLATLIAVLVSRRTTRLGRPSTLRWAEQG